MPKRSVADKPRKPSRISRAAAASTILPLAIGLGNSFMATIPARATVETAAVATATTAAEAEPAVCEDVIDTDDCHSRYPAGCSANGSYDAALSFLKDRLDFPAVTSAPLLRQADFAGLEAKIPKGVRTKNHGDFLEPLKAVGEQQQYALVGYLYPSKTEGSESSNCQLEGDEAAVDFHLYIGFDPDIAKQLRDGKTFKGAAKQALNRQSVIVEMTPHFRERFEPDWTFENVGALIGRQVKVVGQLLLDNEHNIPSQNCGLPNAKLDSCWRASAWELHPVTQFWVCPTDSCEVNGSAWVTVAKANQ